MKIVTSMKTEARGVIEAMGAPLVMVFGLHRRVRYRVRVMHVLTYGRPLWSEKEGQILEAFPGVGSAGQQAPSANCATLPSAAAFLNPAQFEQDTDS